MRIEIQIPEGLAKFVRALKPESRKNLFAAAGSAIQNLINNHLKRIAPSHHKTADRLGATQTGHLEPPARFHATADYAEIIIPIPGINRAYKNLSRVPKDKPYLTLPISSVSYGRRAGEVRRLGYMIFRPAAKGSHRLAEGGYSQYQDILMGSKENETIPLYLLKTRVNQKRDPSLLPSLDRISQTAGVAMMAIIGRYAKGAA